MYFPAARLSTVQNGRQFVNWTLDSFWSNEASKKARVPREMRHEPWPSSII